MEDRIRALLAHPRWPVLAQAVTLAVAVPALGALFLGPGQGERNGGSFALWHLWWAAIPLVALLFGRLWCAVCPVSLLDAACGPRWRPALRPGVLAGVESFLLAASILAVHLLYLWSGLEENIPASRVFVGTTVGLAVAATLSLRGRLWCRCLCPAGAFSGVLARIAPWRLVVDPARCDRSCAGTLCRSKDGAALCPVGEDPRLGIDAGACIECGDCLSACPAVRPARSRRSPLPPAGAVPTLVLLGIVADGLLVQINDWPILFWQLCTRLGIRAGAWQELALHALIVAAPLLAAIAFALPGRTPAFAGRLALIAGAALPVAAAAAAAIAARALLVAAPQHFADLIASAGLSLPPVRAFGRALDGAPMRLLQEIAVVLGLFAALRRLAPVLRDTGRRVAAVGAVLLCACACALLAWGFSRPLGLS